MRSTIRFGSRVVLAALIACAASLGCSKAAPPTPAPPSNAASTLSSSTARIEIGRFGVNEPRADGRACWTARYTLSVADRSLHVETCVDDDPIDRDVTLSAADLRAIQTSLDAVREASGATAACDSKGAAFLVELQDRSRQLVEYTDSANTCHAGDMKILDRAGVESLFSTFATIDANART